MINKIKKLSAVLCCTFLVGMISGCSANGAVGKSGDNDVLVKFNQGSINHDELFNEMVKTSGMAATLQMADKAMLDEILPATDEMKESASLQIEQSKQYYGDNFENLLKSSGLTGEQEYSDIIVFNFQREGYILKYIKENVLTEEGIQKYYDEYEPKITASHILIQPEEDTEDGWNKALKTSKDLIERLDKDEDFAKLAIEFSKDPGSAQNGGDLGAFGKGDMLPEFEKAAYELNVNEYTKEPVKSKYGYHIILKTDEEKKGTLEEMRPEIMDTLSEKLKDDNIIANKALVKMRKDNGFTINNEVIKEQYDTFLKNLEDSENADNNEK